jgi:DNA-binding NtrC family response regulator
MQPQIRVQSSIANRFSTCVVATCPPQILVIDACNGPASILISTVSLLLDQEVSVTTLDDHTDALRALSYYEFDLVVVGLQVNRPLQLTILPHIHEQNPQRPLLAVGRDLPRQYQQYARTYGVQDVLNMPERAADLKRLVRRMAERYLFQTA